MSERSEDEGFTLAKAQWWESSRFVRTCYGLGALVAVVVDYFLIAAIF